MSRDTTKYGPRVLGEEAFAKQKAAATLSSREGTVYGSRLRDSDEPAVSDASPPSGAGAESLADASIPEVKELLETSPDRYDEVLRHELSERDEPRVGVLKHLLAVEEGRTEPRSNVVKILEDALRA